MEKVIFNNKRIINKSKYKIAGINQSNIMIFTQSFYNTRNKRIKFREVELFNYNNLTLSKVFNSYEIRLYNNNRKGCYILLNMEFIYSSSL